MAEVPDAVLYSRNVSAAELHSHKPPFTLESTKWEEGARKVLSASSWGYLHGNGGAGSTYDKNIASFNRYGIVPRFLVPSRKDKDGHELFVDTTTTVLGRKILFLIAMAPIGVQRIFHREGEPASARAAASVGMPFILSSSASTSIEDAAEAHQKGYETPKLNMPILLTRSPNQFVGFNFTGHTRPR